MKTFPAKLYRCTHRVLSYSYTTMQSAHFFHATCKFSLILLWISFTWIGASFALFCTKRPSFFRLCNLLLFHLQKHLFRFHTFLFLRNRKRRKRIDHKCARTLSFSSTLSLCALSSACVVWRSLTISVCWFFFSKAWITVRARSWYIVVPFWHVFRSDRRTRKTLIQQAMVRSGFSRFILADREMLPSGWSSPSSGTKFNLQSALCPSFSRCSTYWDSRRWFCKAVAFLTAA